MEKSMVFIQMKLKTLIKNRTIFYIKRKIYFKTTALIADPNNHSEAGKVFTDWYLPSATELEEIYRLILESNNGVLNKNTVRRQFPCILYWCSTENDAYSAYYYNMLYGYSQTKFKTEYLGIRAIRKF